MGWIWFKGIKTTKPAKTASLMLDTHSHGWGELLGEGPLRKDGWSGGLTSTSLSHFQDRCRDGAGRRGSKQGAGIVCTSSHFLGHLRSPTLHLGLQHRGVWLAAPGSPRKWPQGTSHPDTHLPLPGGLATWGQHRECPRSMGSEPGDVRSFSQTHIKAQNGEGGEPDSCSAQFI